ncbi:heterokaryon incompatibility protein-domain-containing protein [Bisporella sp. PMI_857]|nr:heterokaryon incompatibility protein-domain-containing protein [Bisporella sp. PMI_857]
MSNTVPGQQSQSYGYGPLASERSIRIVEVRGSDKPDAELCCTLKEEDLGDSPSYEAISYAWEGQTPSHRISCDGLDLLVTGNCAEILRHFRPKSPEQSRRLWIDAICINQSSVLEKNHQLKLMGDVYRKAKCVLVWLAPSKNQHYIPHMFRWLCQLSALAAQEPTRVALGPGNPEQIGGMVVFGASLDFADWALVFKCQEILKYSEYYGFMLFKNIPWFTRLWTVQEVAMAGEALLISGEDTLPFSAVGRLYVELKRLSPYDSAVAKIGESLFSVLGPHFKMAQQLWILEQGQTPLFSFSDFTGLKVSDPKDKVFAVQGLLSALGVTLPDPDYSKPLSTIYLDAYRALIAHQGQIGILDELNCCCLVQMTPGLPSWVPQVFGNHRPNTPTPMPLKELQEPRFRLSKDGLRLHVNGLQIDTVACVSESLIGSFSAENASRLPPDVRAKTCAGTASYINLARELYGIRTVVRWVEFAVSHEPVSVTGQVMEALHSCLLLGAISDAYLRKRSYNDFARWIEVLVDDSQGVRCHEAIGEGIDHPSNWYASLIERYRKEQETDHLTVMEEFRILQLISQDRGSSEWQQSIRRLGFMTLFKTASGKLGIGAFPIQAGDIVVYIFGNHTPLCLRPDANNEEYKIVAPVYVHGMIGDIAWNENGEGYRQFTII